MNNKSFLGILPLRSSDTRLNLNSLDLNELNVFRSKGINLIHLNVNSLLPKVDEIRYIAECTKAAVIRITESKLDESVFQSEAQKYNYDLLQYDKQKRWRCSVLYKK